MTSSTVTKGLDKTTPEQNSANGRGRPRGATLYGPGGADIGKGASREARRVAAMVLEVLAGARTPTEAAQALELSVPRYYQLETRALHGLLASCEALPKGRVVTAEHELRSLRRDNERLQREVTRQQSLVRAAQRTVGLPPPVPLKTTSKKTRRRRVARALNLAARLHNDQPQDQGQTVTAAAPSLGEQQG